MIAFLFNLVSAGFLWVLFAFGLASYLIKYMKE